MERLVQLLVAAVLDDHVLDGLVAAVGGVGLDLPHDVDALKRNDDNVSTSKVSSAVYTVYYILDRTYLDDFPEDNVPSVQPGSLLDGEEELGPVGVLAGVGHRQPAHSVVLQLEVLVGELFAVDGPASGALRDDESLHLYYCGAVNGVKTLTVALCEISALQHEVLDDPVELGLLVALSLRLRGQLGEVLHSLRDLVEEKTDVADTSVNLMSWLNSIRTHKLYTYTFT
jgi:hypothetical protein